MGQGTLNRCRRRNHGLASFRTQFAKMRLNGLVPEKISRPCARQPNRLQREGIEPIQCLGDIGKVSAQPGCGIGLGADHTDRGTRHPLWHQCPEFSLRGWVRLRCREPQRAIAPVVTLTHLRHPSSRFALRRNISRTFSGAVPTRAQLTLTFCNRNTRHD